MSAIPKNAIVTVIVGDAQTVSGFTGGLNASDVLSAVSAYLDASGKYTVESSSSSGSMLSTITPLIQETFQATIKMQVYYDIDTTEILGDISLAFETVTNQSPSQITIPSFTTGSNAVVQATGQAAASTTATQGVADSISNFLSKITSTAKSLLIGLAAIIIIALVLIAYGPNIGSIARAAA
jgi:hypothetical protein